MASSPSALLAKSPERLPLWQAGLWTVALGSMFFLVYGTCNWWTSLRPGIGSFYWNWETKLPFVPWLVLPYMSLDLFFAGAIFLCSLAEIKIHSKRVATAILIAAACFLLFPLRFAFARPPVGGFSGLLFDWLRLDQPFNQMPSLHIALLFIVWAPYGRRVHGLLRWVLIVWFVLIGVSAVLTYQHHVIDIIGGGVLTVIIYYLYPWSTPVDEVAPRSSNYRLASIYGFCALVVLAVAYALRPWGFFLLWPAVSLALVTIAYGGAGPRIFRKHDGRLAWAAMVLLGPFLLVSRITHRMYRNAADPWNELGPNLILGRQLTARESERLASLGVTAVLDLTSECIERRKLRQFAYHNLQIVDHTMPSDRQLEAACRFIEEHSRSGKVFVHCALGFSRSAGVLAAYLMESSAVHSFEEAESLLRTVRPRILLSRGWKALLEQRAKVSST